jgi:3-hydroxyacyl-CoA dehydrogenase
MLLCRKGIAIMKGKVFEPAAWVNDMLAAGNKSFYTVKDGATYFTTFLKSTNKIQVKMILLS